MWGKRGWFGKWWIRLFSLSAVGFLWPWVIVHLHLQEGAWDDSALVTDGIWLLVVLLLSGLIRRHLDHCQHGHRSLSKCRPLGGYSEESSRDGEGRCGDCKGRGLTEGVGLSSLGLQEEVRWGRGEGGGRLKMPVFQYLKGLHCSVKGQDENQWVKVTGKHFGPNPK